MAIGDAPKPSDKEAVPKIELRELSRHELGEAPIPARGGWEFAKGFEGTADGAKIKIELWTEPKYGNDGLDYGDHEVCRGWKNREELTAEEAKVLWNKYWGSVK